MKKPHSRSKTVVTKLPFPALQVDQLVESCTRINTIAALLEGCGHSGLIEAQLVGQAGRLLVEEAQRMETFIEALGNDQERRTKTATARQSRMVLR